MSGFYNPNRDTKLSANASSYELETVMLQKWKEEWRPFTYDSKLLPLVEYSYTQIKKEALAVIWACKRFRNFIIGNFLFESDHNPSLSLLGTQTLDTLPTRI